MPRNQGDADWKVSEVKKVVKTLHHRSKVSPKDRLVNDLAESLNRSPKSVVRVCKEVRSGENRLLKTEHGNSELSKYVLVKKSKAMTIVDRLIESAKVFKSKEPVISESEHKKIVDAMLKETKAMVRIAYAWGHNKAISDVSGMVNAIESMNPYDQNNDKSTIMKTSQILFKNGKS